MACTAIALIDPIFARLFFVHLDVDFPLARVMTYTLMDGILLWLAVWDWQHGRRPAVYPAMLIVLVRVQAPAFFLYRLPVGRDIALG